MTPGTRRVVLSIATTGLTAGTWSVNFTAAGDPTVHSAPFQIR